MKLHKNIALSALLSLMTTLPAYGMFGGVRTRLGALLTHIKLKPRTYWAHPITRYATYGSLATTGLATAYTFKNIKNATSTCTSASKAKFPIASHVKPTPKRTDLSWRELTWNYLPPM